jgi:L-ascorbate metabolism protein UlaG (beta-lactamase superfamily)
MRRIIGLAGRLLLLGVAAACLALTVIPPFLDFRHYDGPESGHYDGERFFNPDVPDTILPTGGRSRGRFFARWVLGMDERAEWPDTVAVTPSKPAPRVDGDAMVATWVGHATVLVQTQGVNILTDPIWAKRAGPFGLGPRRVAAPGIAFDDLPKIDLVLVSHSHYDHLHLGTLRRLWERDKPLILTGLGNDRLIAQGGARAVALDWGQRRAIKPGVDAIFTRNHHWGTRWIADRNRTLWGSFVVRTPGGNIFFAGDTGWGDGKWPGEAAAHGPVRLALIPIGAFRFRPGQMDSGSHIGPIQAVDVFKGLRASRALPIHWGTFQLSNEARDTPPRMLAEVMKCHGFPDQRPFAPTAIGQPVAIPPYAPAAASRAPDARCIAGPAITALK